MFHCSRHGMILQVRFFWVSLDIHWGDEHPLPLGHEGFGNQTLHPPKINSSNLKMMVWSLEISSWGLFSGSMSVFRVYY